MWVVNQLLRYSICISEEAPPQSVDRYGIKRVATLKISCLPGHHINSKLRHLQTTWAMDLGNGLVAFVHGLSSGNLLCFRLKHGIVISRDELLTYSYLLRP